MTMSKRYLTNNRYDEYRRLVDCIHDYRNDHCDIDDLARTLLQTCGIVNFEIKENGEFYWRRTQIRLP